MARIFIDTSSLLKLYVAEPDSPAIMALIGAADCLLISDLTPLELRSALYRRVRDKSISSQDAVVVIQAFTANPHFYEQLPVDRNCFHLASNLLDQFAVSNGLRPPDALQLATALEAHQLSPLDLFLTSDRNLAATARACGLVVKP